MVYRVTNILHYSRCTGSTYLQLYGLKHVTRINTNTAIELPGIISGSKRFIPGSPELYVLKRVINSGWNGVFIVKERNNSVISNKQRKPKSWERVGKKKRI